MARRWCTFFIHLYEAPDFDKGQDCWLPGDSVFIPMCNERYISKPKNKEIRSVSRKTDSPMLLLSCSHFSGWIPIWSMDAIPRNPSYSASFSPLIFLLHYPFLISLYLWLNMYFSKDADSVPPTFESPWIHRGWTPAIWNLEKWYIWTYLQSRNRDTDMENKCMDTKKREAEGGMSWELGIDIYTLLCIK